MHYLSGSLNNFFSEELSSLQCNETTRAYIGSVFSKYKTTESDFSKESITLIYAKAKDNQDFLVFQNIADWIFFCHTLFPEHLSNASEEYYCIIGQLSYYSCYRIVRRQLKLYEELADNFIPLSISTRNIIRRHQNYIYASSI